MSSAQSVSPAVLERLNDLRNTLSTSQTSFSPQWLSQLIDEICQASSTAVTFATSNGSRASSSTTTWPLSTRGLASRDRAFFLDFLGPTGPFFNALKRHWLDTRKMHENPGRYAQNCYAVLASPSRLLPGRGLPEEVAMSPLQYWFFRLACWPLLKNNRGATEASNDCIGVADDSLYFSLITEYHDFLIPGQDYQGYSVKNDSDLTKETPSHGLGGLSVPSSPAPWSTPGGDGSLSAIGVTLSRLWVTTLTDLWLRASLLGDAVPNSSIVRLVRILTKRLFYFVGDQLVSLAWQQSVTSSASQTETNFRTVGTPSSHHHSHHPPSMLHWRQTCLAEVFQSPMFHFLAVALSRWPLDPSFRLLLETFLSYIQPWRYYAGEVVTNTAASSFSLSTSATIPDDAFSEAWLPFLAHNHVFYSILTGRVLQHLSRANLASVEYAVCVWRVAKVLAPLRAALTTLDSVLSSCHNAGTISSPQHFSSLSRSHMVSVDCPPSVHPGPALATIYRVLAASKACSSSQFTRQHSPDQLAHHTSHHHTPQEPFHRFMSDSTKQLAIEVYREINCVLSKTHVPAEKFGLSKIVSSLTSAFVTGSAFQGDGADEEIAKVSSHLAAAKTIFHDSLFMITDEDAESGQLEDKYSGGDSLAPNCQGEGNAGPIHRFKSSAFDNEAVIQALVSQQRKPFTGCETELPVGNDEVPILVKFLNELHTRVVAASGKTLSPRDLKLRWLSKKPILFLLALVFVFSGIFVTSSSFLISAVIFTFAFFYSLSPFIVRNFSVI